MRILLDTNVLISALIFPGGAPEEVYRLALGTDIELITSPQLLAELGRTLVGKFGWGAQRAEEAIAGIVGVGSVVKPRETITEITTDPADNRVLEAAAAGEAQVIVSGDRHLLRLRSWRGIPIRTPSAFLTDFDWE